jgi:hypothetical protein
MGRFPTLGVGFRPVGMLFALGAGFEDVFGLGLMLFGLFLSRRAAARRSEQEQPADEDRAKSGCLTANRRHR